MGPAHPRSAGQWQHSRVRLAAVALVATATTAIGVTAASATTSGANVKVAKTALGRILVNSQGMTLYMFALDKGGKSACYGSCATYWPPLVTSSRHVAGAGVRASLLGTTMRKGGTLQVTYAGHPLYRFIKDGRPGQTSGQGLNASGGLWWVLTPAGTVLRKTASAPAAKAAAATATTSGYGGG